MRTPRRVTAAALAVAVLGVPVTLALAVVLAPAAEASTYRYWSYWWGERPDRSATWQYASQGPATHTVADTWVLGWRFATAPENGASPPRQSARFTDLCPGLDTPVVGSVRVALVVDYGSASDAPPGQTPPTSSSVRVECLTLPTTSRVTGSTVLAAAGVAVRTEAGLVCALDGYPKGECAPLVAPAPTTTSPTTTPTRTRTAAPAPSRSDSPATASTPTTTSPRATGTAAGRTASGAGTPAPSSSSSSSTTATTSSGTRSAAPGDLAVAPEEGVTPEETLPAASGSPARPDTGSPAGFALGALAVVAVSAAAWTASRRGGGA